MGKEKWDVNYKMGGNGEGKVVFHWNNWGKWGTVRELVESVAYKGM